MSNHLHLIISARNKDLSDELRDFKKYTNKQIIATIEHNQHEGRKDWILRIFREHGKVIAERNTSSFDGRACPAPYAGIISRSNYIVRPISCKR